MKAFITGGAGFIGSSMADRLLLGPRNHVTIFDNFSWGHSDFLPRDNVGGRLKVISGDLLDLEAVKEGMSGHDIVYHFASNADIARGLQDTSLDVRQSIITTYNVLEAMRHAGVGQIVFASGSGIYGDVGDELTNEDHGPLLPISMYGAGKLGAEALISAFCHLFDMRCHILRLANVVGPRQTHGVALDFIRKLLKSPDRLLILGDGQQRKSYIHIDDVLDAIFFLDAMCDQQINLYNVATNDSVDVNWIAKAVVEAMRLPSVIFEYTGGDRGWPGDVPVVNLDASRLFNLGWRPRLTSELAVAKSIQELLERVPRETTRQAGA